MSVLGREDILKADDLDSEVITVEQWGGSVRVRALTAIERNSLGLDFVSSDGTADMSRVRPDFFARVVCLCVIDEDGERVFSDDDVDAVGAKHADAIQTIVDTCFRLSGMSQEGVDEVKD